MTLRADRIEKLLTSDELESLETSVFSLQPHWMRRHPKWPFFTLGAASYLDARQNGEAAYLREARRTNPILRRELGWLYERLEGCLAERIGEPVRFVDELAVPGFHLFLAHPEFTKPIADLHFDLQYQYIDWSRWDGVDETTQISFTLAVRLPASGGGLSLWAADWSSIAHLAPDERIETIRNNAKKVEEDYEEGSMVVHSGHWLHRIRPSARFDPGDRRITLQGHAIRTGSGWVSYW